MTGAEPGSACTGRTLARLTTGLVPRVSAEVAGLRIGMGVVSIADDVPDGAGSAKAVERLCSAGMVKHKYMCATGLTGLSFYAKYYQEVRVA